MKALSCWKDGEKWYMICDEDGSFSHAVATKDEAVAEGAMVFIEQDEPIFLVRDDSGRGIAEPVSYLQFDSADREYFNRENDDTTDEFTFGEWLDSSSIGDEYRNDDQNFTVIRTR